MLNETLNAFLYGAQFRKLLEQQIEHIQKEYGLYKIDVEIIFYLNKEKEQNTSKDIMQLNMFTRGHISQSLSRLQEKGYVIMEQDKKDRRCTHNYLTPEVQSILDEMEKARDKMQGIIYNGLTETEIASLTSIADKINHNISEYI